MTIVVRAGYMDQSRNRQQSKVPVTTKRMVGNNFLSIMGGGVGGDEA